MYSNIWHPYYSPNLLRFHLGKYSPGKVNIYILFRCAISSIVQYLSSVGWLLIIYSIHTYWFIIITYKEEYKT